MIDIFMILHYRNHHDQHFIIILSINITITIIIIIITITIFIIIGKSERIGRMLQMHANERTEVKAARAGVYYFNCHGLHTLFTQRRHHR